MGASLTVKEDARYLINPQASSGESYDFKTNSNVVDLGAGDWKIESVVVNATAAELNRTTDVSARLVAGGSALTLSEALHDGKTVLLDTAGGTTITLPTPSGSGARYRLVVSVRPSGASHVIKVGNAAHFMVGQIHMLDLDSNAITGYSGAPSVDDTITINNTTTGGEWGDWVELEDTLTLQWTVRGCLTIPTGSNVADPFSATV